MSMPLNDMPIDELIRTARNYANCLQPITTYTEIMHELLNRLDAMRVHAKVLANEAAAIKCMNDCLAEELQAHQPKGAEMHHVWWLCETPLTNAAITALRAEVRNQAHKEGAIFAANRILAAWDAGFVEDTPENAADIARAILTTIEFMDDAPEGDFDRSFADEMFESIAAQLRQEEASHE